MGRKQVAGLALLGAVMFAVPACATKGYVNEQITGVNGKVESLSKTVEETQERTKANESKIGVVDQKVGAAQGAADAARKAATDADAKAGVADAKAGAVDAASRKLIYSVTLSTDSADFATGKWELPDAAKARIDELVARVKADGQNVFFEIEGHTDATGPKELNDKLGLQRAEAAMRYLRDQHQIPLHKVNVISYGPDKPVAPNKTRADRAQNRRIVINVLS
ncbi:MAG TPA: OmpA family protein [Vicinamibacterales bacterium]|nr:OmpA family protein [Vicinamibacterales bacterium]